MDSKSCVRSIASCEAKLEVRTKVRPNKRNKEHTSRVFCLHTSRGESRSELRKITRMAVCRNLENLENIGSDRRNVLRARRSRRPKIAKFQNVQNSNRYDQNVGKVLIGRKMGLKKRKRSFGAKISLISFFFNFWTQGGPPIGLYLAKRLFFCTHRDGMG